MIGLGVGIDYSLFIVTRFRQLLHEGLSPVDAAAEAGASAGRAVLFAGLTVAISVTGLAFFGLDFVTKLGIGSALGVLTTVAIANSLLISVLAKLGKSRGVGIDIMLYVITLGFYGGSGRTGPTRRSSSRRARASAAFSASSSGSCSTQSRLPHSVRGPASCTSELGKSRRCRPWTGLWLFPFGILIVPAIVWFVKVQRALNRYWESESVEAAGPCRRSTG